MADTTRAAWPDGVTTRAYGPRVQAITALCTGAYRLSKRTTQQLLEDLFGVTMSLGTLSTLEAATAQAVAAPVAEARAFVKRQARVSVDETGWRQGNQRAWLWVAVTSWVTVFLVRLSRGSEVARDLLGSSMRGGDILVTDRFSAYNWIRVALAAAVLGASVRGHRSDDRTGWRLAGNRGSAAPPRASDISLVASRP